MNEALAVLVYILTTIIIILWLRKPNPTEEEKGFLYAYILTTVMIVVFWLFRLPPFR